jgi:hypothetical protein
MDFLLQIVSTDQNVCQFQQFCESKLLGSKSSYVTNRVTGTFVYVFICVLCSNVAKEVTSLFFFFCSYVAPECASTGMMCTVLDFYDGNHFLKEPN